MRSVGSGNRPQLQENAAWRAERVEKAVEVATQIAAFNAMTMEERHTRMTAYNETLDAGDCAIPF